MTLQKLKKISMTVTQSLSVLILISCAHVKIEDQAWYADKGVLGAKEFHTLKKVQKPIPLEEWDKLRFGMVCTAPEVFAENEGNLKKLCTDNPRCSFEQYQAIDNFFLVIHELVKERRSEVR